MREIMALKCQNWFKTIVSESSRNLVQGLIKYRITLLNGATWLCYMIGPDDITSTDYSLRVGLNI